MALLESEKAAARSLGRGLQADGFNAIVGAMRRLADEQRRTNDFLDAPEVFRGQGASRALSELADELMKSVDE